MKSIIMTFICLTVINVVCLTIVNADPATDIVIWQKELTYDPNLRCKLAAMAVDNKNKELIVIGTSEAFNTKETELQLWKIDPIGTVKTKKSLGVLPEHNASVAKAMGVKVAVKPDTGDIVRVKSDDDDGSSLSVINRNMQANEVKLKTPTRKDSGRFILHDIKSNKNDRSLLVGQDGKHSVVMKTDSDGNILWEKPFDTGETDILNSLAYDPEGSGFYVAGLSATASSKMSFADAATVWLLHYDDNGEIIANEFFEGGVAPWPSSLPKVICLPSGIVLVVYDKSKNAMATELYAKAYTKELTPLWEKLILKTEEDGPPATFDICATTEDRFVLAGQVNVTDLRVYEYGANGTILQSLELDGEVGVGGMYVDYLDEKILVAFKASTQEDEKEEKIKLMAIKPYKTK